MPEKTEYLRLFYAIELPSVIKDAITAQYDKYSAVSRQVKWTKPENLHLTLRFLGNVDVQVVPQLQMIMDAMAGSFESFTYSLRGVGCFPSPQRPSILWIGADKGAKSLVSLAVFLEDNLSGLGFKRENRPFKPHITIGRIKFALNKMFTQEIKNIMHNDQNMEFGQFMVTEILLIKSVLTSAGPVYTIVGTSKLEKSAESQ